MTMENRENLPHVHGDSISLHPPETNALPSPYLSTTRQFSCPLHLTLLKKLRDLENLATLQQI